MQLAEVFASASAASAAAGLWPASVGSLTTYDMSAIEWGFPVLCDVDNDGDRDLLMGTSSGLRLLLNSGSDAAPALAADATPTGLWTSDAQVQPACGDVDGDGDDDVLLADDTSGITYFANDGNGTYAAAAIGLPSVDGNGKALYPALGDLNDDGLADLVVGGYRVGVVTTVLSVDGDFSGDYSVITPPSNTFAPSVCEGSVTAGVSYKYLYTYDFDVASGNLTNGVDATDSFNDYNYNDYDYPRPACATDFGSATSKFLLGNADKSVPWYVNASAAVDPGTAPTAAVAGNGSVLATWDAPADDGGAAVTAYTVSCGDSDTTTVTATSTTLVNVPAGACAVSVSAVNAAGSTPYASSSASVTVPGGAPDAPVFTTCGSFDSATAIIEWDAPANDGGSALTSFNLVVDGVASALSATTISVSVPGDVGATVSFSLQSVNALGSSAAATCDATITRQTVMANLDRDLAFDSFPEGAFQPVTSNGGGEQQPLLADINVDGATDLLMLGDDGSNVYLNTGTDAAPVFEPSNALWLALGVNPFSVDAAAFGDIDQDGNNDLVVCISHSCTTFYGNGDGTYTYDGARDATWAVYSLYNTVALADTTGDGVPEFFALSGRSTIVQYSLVNGFYEYVGVPTGLDVDWPLQLSFSFCDADADGDQDVFVGQGTVGTVVKVGLTLLLNDGTGASFSTSYVSWGLSGLVACAAGINGADVGGLVNDVGYMYSAMLSTTALNTWALRWVSQAVQTPGAVTAAPRITDTGVASAFLEWEAPDSDGGATITQYDVYVHSSDETDEYTFPVTGSPAPTSAWVISLQAGLVTNFTVAARNGAGAGDESPVSNNTVPVGGDPDPPIVLAAYATAATIAVSVSSDRQYVNNGGDLDASHTFAVSTGNVQLGEVADGLDAPYYSPGVMLVPDAPVDLSSYSYIDGIIYVDQIYRTVLTWDTDYGYSSAFFHLVPWRETTTAFLGDLVDLSDVVNGNATVTTPHFADLTCDGVTDMFVTGNAIGLVTNDGTDAVPDWTVQTDGNPLSAVISTADQLLALGDVTNDGFVDAVVCTPGQLYCQVAVNDGQCNFELSTDTPLATTEMPYNFYDIELAALYGDDDYPLLLVFNGDSHGPLFEYRVVDGAYQPQLGWESLTTLAWREMFISHFDTVSLCDLTGDGLLDILLTDSSSSTSGNTVLPNSGNVSAPSFGNGVSGNTAAFDDIQPGLMICAPGLYSVTAFGTSGSDGEEIKFYGLQRVPTPPAALNVSADAAGVIDFSWSPPADEGSGPVTSYKLRVTTTEPDSTTQSTDTYTVDADATTYSVGYNHQLDGGSVVAQISAYNDVGSSESYATGSVSGLPTVIDDDDDGGGGSDHTLAIVLGVAAAIAAVVGAGVVYQRRLGKGAASSLNGDLAAPLLVPGQTDL